LTSELEFTELHKFEENIDGNLVFRAKKEGIHIVYCVDKRKRIIFLRAFRNYGEYGKFLEDKKEIKRMIAHEQHQTYSVGRNWPKLRKTVKASAPEEKENEVVKKKEERKKARVRTRGPYRKAHADW
jgi:hypothetical protein